MTSAESRRKSRTRAEKGRRDEREHALGEVALHDVEEPYVVESRLAVALAEFCG